MKLLLALVALLLPARSQDDVEVPSHTSTVDALPYLEALQERFASCLAAEGTELPPADAATVKETLETVAPLLPWTSSGSCTSSEAAVAECAAAAAATPCDLLGANLEAALRGELAGAQPEWAVAYGNALAERVGACFVAETGRELTKDEDDDLDGFRSLLAQTLANVATSCPVDGGRAATCTAAVAEMPCTALATALANDDVELLVTSFVTGCEGFLDCGE